MEYDEEIQARNLYVGLTDELKTLLPEAEFSIEGKGVHWRCFAKLGDRMCEINCFGDGQYKISFKTDSIREATGRTLLEKELILATSDWLQGHTLGELYAAFGFVDYGKRALFKFREDTLSVFPELEQSATIKLDQFWGEFYELWFNFNDRSVHLSFYGRNQFPDAKFYWDECFLF